MASTPLILTRTIHVAAMSNPNDEDQKDSVPDCVEDSIITDAYSKDRIVAVQGLGACRSRVRCEAVNRTGDPTKGGSVFDLLEVPLGRGFELNGVARLGQPSPL